MSNLDQLINDFSTTKSFSLLKEIDNLSVSKNIALTENQLNAIIDTLDTLKIKIDDLDLNQFYDKHIKFFLLNQEDLKLSTIDSFIKTQAEIARIHQLTYSITNNRVLIHNLGTIKHSSKKPSYNEIATFFKITKYKNILLYILERNPTFKEEISQAMSTQDFINKLNHP